MRMTGSKGEIFAYVRAREYSEFLRVQEDLLLHIVDIVESTGTALALPIQVTHVVREPDADARRPKEKTTALGER